MPGEDNDPADSQCPIRAAIGHLCQELNLDASSAAEALRDFTALRGTYSLEGETVHWLACALYVACRKSIIPTVGSGMREGNCVSLTRILRSAKLSLIQFFSKMKKWMDMSNMPQEFRERVERLERNFEVSAVIFKKFKPIFLVIFKNPDEEQPKLQRSRKHRRVPCNVKDLFNFCWTLFVYTKGNFNMIGGDLVNSYHLLLCCLDLVFANALLCPHKRDLLNSSFKGLPEDFHTADVRTSEGPPCIIATLCELHDGLLVEAKTIKEHYFKPYISKLCDREILKGDCLLDCSNFADNNKALNKEYEEYVLTEGDFDERVFLGEDAEEEIGTPRKFSTDVPSGKVMTRAHVECYLQQHFEKKRSFTPSTPLTGRRYLREKEQVITPVASATQSVSRLQSIVAGLKNAPSEQLIAIFESCIQNPVEMIMNRVKEIGEVFCQNYTQSTDDQPGSHIDFAVNRLKLAEILYYKILETIMVQEMRRLHGKDMSALLEQDIFHRSLLACCLEIVLFAYSSPRTFPWIIEILNLRPFYFYKVIEILIRSEEGLSRDMVKHLNSIEEQILESLAWTKDSALWDALQASENKVPTCEEVIFPCNFETGNGGRGLGHLPMMPVSPIVHPRVKEVRTNLGESLRRDMQPLSPISVHDRYSSPVAGSAKRRLFGDESPKEKPAEKNLTEGTRLKIAPVSSFVDENVPVSTEQTVLAMTTATVTGQKITLHGNILNKAGEMCIPLAKLPEMKIVYTSISSHSYSLFVYHLASVRLRDLCIKLDVSNDLRRKIWTCFEFTLVHCTDLMKDRHLDQLLICALFIMAKVSKDERTFQDIMKCYRNQPQANSHVSMFSSTPCHRVSSVSSYKMKEACVLPLNLTFVKLENGLSVFNSAIFLSKVEAPSLSPFPSIKHQPVSPRRISQQHSVYVSPHKNGACLTPKTALLYKFNGSPSKRPKKRAISIDSDTESPAKRLCQENDDVLLKRLQDVVSERANH
uniref:Retinoblastoma-like protein 1 n=1 Tax=Podarcis muralis TaxID=64176 RepID=A0A670JWF6_PODMU